MLVRQVCAPKTSAHHTTTLLLPAASHPPPPLASVLHPVLHPINRPPSPTTTCPVPAS